MGFMRLGGSLIINFTSIKNSSEDPQSLECHELNYFSPCFTSNVYLLMARFDEGFADPQKQVRDDSPRFNRDSVKSSSPE